MAWRFNSVEAKPLSGAPFDAACPRRYASDRRNAAAMPLTLTPQLEALVRQKVDAGLYHSPGQVLEEALRLLDERDASRQQRLEELRREIAVGLEQLDRGEGVPGEQVFEALRDRSRRLREAQR
jgi:antitoxin ParD1/3/4